VVAKWFVYHLTALELLLAIVPFAVAPIAVWRLLAEARRGGVREAAFASAFVTLSITLLLVAAVFSSVEAGLDRLHDRYLFYVAPLWFVAFVVWLRDGLPRPLIATVLGIGFTVVLPVITPYARLASDNGGETDAVTAHLARAIRDAAIAVSPQELSGKGCSSLWSSRSPPRSSCCRGSSARRSSSRSRPCSCCHPLSRGEAPEARRATEIAH